MLVDWVGYRGSVRGRFLSFFLSRLLSSFLHYCSAWRLGKGGREYVPRYIRMGRGHVA